MRQRNIIPLSFQKNKQLPTIHPATLDILIFTILLVGLLSVASSAITGSLDEFRLSLIWEKAEIFRKQMKYAIVGIGVYLILPKFISMSFLFKHRFKICLFSLFLLLLVYSPIGVEINHSRRWVNLFIQFQPSEIAKIGLIIFLAGFFYEKRDEFNGAWYKMPLKMGVILGVFLTPIIFQNLSTSVVYIVIALAMLLVAGYRLSIIFIISLGSMLLVYLMAILFEYRLGRLDFLYPWTSPLGNGYQILNALIAQKFGGWFGSGYAMSIQKLSILPIPHNDFILSVMIEEWGMLPVMSVILFLYYSLIYVILTVAKKAFYQSCYSSSYFCYGIATWLFVQSSVNLFVNLGVIPTTGLNLPLISYGGTSLITTLIALSLVRKVIIEIENGDKNSLQDKNIFTHFWTKLTQK